MKQNTIQVFRAWQRGIQNEKQDSIWTDGYDIYSYDTAIVTRVATSDRVRSPLTDATDWVILNRTKYSKTTTTHQNALAVLLDQEQFKAYQVEGVSEGTQAVALWSIVAETWLRFV